MNPSNNISPFVSSHLPEFIRVDHPTIVSFLETYYEWLEGQELLSPMNLEGLSDVDDTLDRFVDHFKREFLLDFPDALALSENGTPVNPRKLVKIIKSFYRAKGTEKSFQFLFRILYDTTVDFYYPKNDILRLSDGKWIKRFSFRVPNTGDSIFAVAGNRVYQRNATGNIVASARVLSVNTFQIGFYNVAEVFVTGINGTFDTQRPIEFFDGVGKTFTTALYPVVGNITITNGGSNYKVGDAVSFIKAEGDSGRGAYGVVSQVSASGAVTKIEIQNFGVNYLKNPTISIESDIGSGFVGSVRSVSYCDYAGYYANNDGRLSTNKVMQDNHYFQEFSYVLLSEITIDKYRDAIRRLIHPAGLGVFGQVKIVRCSRADLSHHNIIDAYQIPYIGNYTPYTFLTIDDLASWFKVDGISVGYDPTTHDTLIISQGDGNPITSNVPFEAGDPDFILNTPGTEGDPFWIIFEHPNRVITDPVVARIWNHEKDDFLFTGEGGVTAGDYSNSWREWTLGSEYRKLWDETFSGQYKNAQLLYQPGNTEFRRVTINSFFEMPNVAPFDCRSELIVQPIVPSVALTRWSNLAPQNGAAIVGSGSMRFFFEINNPDGAYWYNTRKIKLVMSGTRQKTAIVDWQTQSTVLTGIVSGNYTVSAHLLDAYDKKIVGSDSNVLSFQYIYNKFGGIATPANPPDNI